MTDSAVEHAAGLLLQARLQRTRIDLPGALATEDEAYAVQDRVIGALGAVGGWKVGAKSPAAVPTCAPLLASTLRASPAVLAAESFHMIGIEAELAFRLGRDLPPGHDDLPRAAVLDAISSVHAAVEVVDTRLLGWQSCDRLWLLADCQMNAGLVYGAASPDWRLHDLAVAPVRLTVNGGAVAEARGGNPGGDPCRLLTWLVNHVRRWRSGLRADCLVTTGSCTGMIFVEPGSTIQVEFPGLGTATATFPGAR